MRVAPKRVALVAAAAALVVGWVLVFVARTWGTATPPPVHVPRDAGGAAFHAPRPPSLPGQPGSVRLTGLVVDGAGLPIVGAEVSAEPEKGAPDRALATSVALDAGVPGDA